MFPSKILSLASSQCKLSEMGLGNLWFTHTPGTSESQASLWETVLHLYWCMPQITQQMQFICNQYQIQGSAYCNPGSCHQLAQEFRRFKVNLASVSKVIYSLNMYVYLVPRDGSQRLEKQHVFLGPKALSRWLLNEPEGSVVTCQNPASVSTWSWQKTKYFKES